MQTYWDEAIETISAGKLERLESERLSEQIAYMYETSPLYRHKMDAAGVRAADIVHRDDLARIPFTEKAELTESQRGGTLIGPHQCAPLDAVVRITGTGGTTGRPLRVGFTRRDNEDYAEMGARALWAMGCRRGEIVFECMNYNLYAGGLPDHMTFERLGAATIPFGVGNSKRLLEMMMHLQDEVGIWSTPSYAIRLAEVAAEEGIDPRTVGLRRGYFSGEAGIQIPGMRERIESLWDMRAMDQYGTGELGLHSGECARKSGVHYGATGFVLTELIDPETEQPVTLADGVTGEFVYTSIRREACPLLRMRSHDVMQVFTEPCACGRTSFRFTLLGRSDDMFIVKGVNVFPNAVQSVIAVLQPRLTGEIQIVLDRAPPIDYAPRVQVEVAREVPESAYADLLDETREVIRAGLNFTAAVEFVSQGTIASERKTRRLYRLYQGDELPSTGPTSSS